MAGSATEDERVSGLVLIHVMIQAFDRPHGLMGTLSLSKDRMHGGGPK